MIFVKRPGTQAPTVNSDLLAVKYSSPLTRAYDNSVNESQTPLCVDCDGTLLRTDMLHEAFFLLLRQSPGSLPRLPIWLLRGKAHLKQQLAAQVRLDVGSLPVNQDVLALIHAARREGRRVVLATASPRTWADAVARHLDVFDEVFASDGTTNLSGAKKAERLGERFGDKQFDYVGNDRADLPVWGRSAGAFVVSSSPALARQAARVTEVRQIIEPNNATLLTYLRALRLHQWLKNLLVWVPLAAAHQLESIQGLTQGLIAFLAFSLCASAVYVLNDLLDLEADRAHVRKRKRAFASGDIPIWRGVAMIPALLAGSLALALQLPLLFLGVLGLYFAMTVAYSLRLKQQVIVDVLLLAALYTMRIIAGAAATQTPASFWMLAFSIFIFLSLAALKRYSELLVTLKQNRQEAPGRGYLVNDLPVLMAIGVSAGMAAVMVLALYVNAPESTALYEHKLWLWLLPPAFLYWVIRIWLKAHRGQVDDDPVVFTARDWQSTAIGVLVLGLVWLAR